MPPAELRTRLREGKIYRPDNAARALDGFFKEGNLAALREIALRRAAAHVDDDVRDWMRRAGVAGPWPAGERVLALVGPDKGSEGVVRHAKRLAEALHAPWIALHVERDNTVAAARPALALGGAARRRCADPGRLRPGRERPSSSRRATNVTHLVMGRAATPLWRRLTGRVLSVQMLRRAPRLRAACHSASGCRRPASPPRTGGLGCLGVGRRAGGGRDRSRLFVAQRDARRGDGPGLPGGCRRWRQPRRAAPRAGGRREPVFWPGTSSSSRRSTRSRSAAFATSWRCCCSRSSRCSRAAWPAGCGPRAGRRRRVSMACAGSRIQPHVGRGRDRAGAAGRARAPGGRDGRPGPGAGVAR